MTGQAGQYVIITSAQPFSSTALAGRGLCSLLDKNVQACRSVKDEHPGARATRACRTSRSKGTASCVLNMLERKPSLSRPAETRLASSGLEPGACGVFFKVDL